MIKSLKIGWNWMIFNKCGLNFLFLYCNKLEKIWLQSIYYCKAKKI